MNSEFGNVLWFCSWEIFSTLKFHYSFAFRVVKIQIKSGWWRWLRGGMVERSRKVIPNDVGWVIRRSFNADKLWIQERLLESQIWQSNLSLLSLRSQLEIVSCEHNNKKPVHAHYTTHRDIRRERDGFFNINFKFQIDFFFSLLHNCSNNNQFQVTRYSLPAFFYFPRGNAFETFFYVTRMEKIS